MNSLYHRFAVASVGIALGFALGANKEARAAIFTFTSTRSYWVVDYDQDGVVDNGIPFPGSRFVGRSYGYVEGYLPAKGEYRSSYEFNIADLPLDSNTRIKSAIFRLGLRVFNTLIFISIPTRMPMASESILH